MTDIMSLDIETANFSWEIGGWENKALFEPSVVATWDGENAHIFTKEDINIEGATVHALHPRVLGDHIEKHLSEGGKLLGHNILGFDLPVLKDSLDCWAAGDALFKFNDQVIDTKNLVQKASLFSTGRVATNLDLLTKYTLSNEKSMKSEEAPIAWREGKFEEVASYCLKDAQLTFDLYKYGQENGIVKSRSLESGEIVEIEVEWK